MAGSCTINLYWMTIWMTSVTCTLCIYYFSCSAFDFVHQQYQILDLYFRQTAECFASITHKNTTIQTAIMIQKKQPIFCDSEHHLKTKHITPKT